MVVEGEAVGVDPAVDVVPADAEADVAMPSKTLRMQSTQRITPIMKELTLTLLSVSITTTPGRSV